MQKEIRVLYIDPKVMVEPKKFSMLFGVDFKGEPDNSVPIDPDEAIDICTNLGWTVKDIEMTEKVDFITHFPIYCPNVIDWFNKNHFDYRGLIEKGLALDATGLGIY